MQDCRLTIITSTDGQENTVGYDGKIDVCEGVVRLIYNEKDAAICITAQKGLVVIERTGDYSLRLHLEEGKKTDGLLGIGGAVGKVQTETYRAKYLLDECVLKLSLRYNLIFSAMEVQEMKLNIKAQIKKR